MIAGRPVVDEGQEAVHSVKTAGKIAFLGEDESMELVFIKEAVGKLFEKAVRAPLPDQLFCVTPEDRCPDADQDVGGDGRDQLFL